MILNLHYELEVFMTRDFICWNGEIYPALTGSDRPGVERLVVKAVVILKLYLSDTLSPVKGLCAPSHSNIKFLLPPSTIDLGSCHLASIPSCRGSAWEDLDLNKHCKPKLLSSLATCCPSCPRKVPRRTCWRSTGTCCASCRACRKRRTTGKGVHPLRFKSTDASTRR